MPVIGRVAMILLAFLIASVASGVTIALALLGPHWPALSGNAELRAGFVVAVVFAASLSAAVAVIPLFLLVVIAEAYRLRSIVLYTVAGAAIVAAGYLLTGAAETLEPAALQFGQGLTIAVAAGTVFGLVYWLVAGRKAGVWHKRRDFSESL